MANIYVIDDQAMIRESLQQTLADADHKVTVFDNAQDALTIIRQRQPDLVLTDLRLPGMDGVGLLREMKRLGLDVPVILMTAYASVSTAVDAMKLGAFDYVQKPFNAEEIAIVIERAIRESNLVRDNEVMRRTIEDSRRDKQLIGDSPSMKAVIEKAQRLAQSSATVLITGESGTGKEMIARTLHASSPRAAQPMLCLNCAALSSTLLESELFGHEKGAFTSAVARRIGRFELARDGTLFLDEVGELPLAIQVKLLRVLQDGDFERVGGTETLISNARIIAATNRDLAKAIESGSFRSDLFYRLNVFPIVVPSLSERRDDIPLLIESFMQQFNRRMGKQIESIDAQSMQYLCARQWPGNIRELLHVIERAMILCDGTCLTVEVTEPVPSRASESVAASAQGAAPALQSVELPPTVSTLEDAQREHIRRALQKTGGVVDGPGGAAAILGLKPSTLRSRMKRLGIHRRPLT
ncbi:MAG: sigma-54-dependent Fis family transcriptional regulator [Planctomycetes bacterium]|nr:sigma-54-dependent Fis family transcriptional regulator [Planctomycetota bacterium]